MEIVDFLKVKKEIFNNMKRKMLIPVLGSGFTRGCVSALGKVPSGEEYRIYMIDKITENLPINERNPEELKNQSFSNISEFYHGIVPREEQRSYLRHNFREVHVEQNKIDFLSLPWPYIYTLNIDDGIENNSAYNHIVYANRVVEDDVFRDNRCVIKLHGDINDMLTYQDSNSEVFTQRQYIQSLDKNISLLSRLKHDSIYMNLIFIGCSLEDEIDLLAYSATENITGKYICITREPSSLERVKYEKYGITHCIIFKNYDEIYRELYQLGIESQKVEEDDLEYYKNFKRVELKDKYEENKPYLLFGKSLINRNQTITRPYFFISRNQTEKILEEMGEHSIQILVGGGCSGKTYILADIAQRISNRDVYIFETKDRLTEAAFEILLKKTDCVLLFDDKSLTDSQIETLLMSRERLKQKQINVIIAADKGNQSINGILKLYEVRGVVKTNDIPDILISSVFQSNEIEKINPLLTAVDAGVFSEKMTLADNIINIGQKLDEKNRFQRIFPRFGNIKELAALIALAIERKIFSNRAITLNLYNELEMQCKVAGPLIAREETWPFETDRKDQSPIKYVINAEYWLCFQLETFSKSEDAAHKIVEAYKYLVSRIIAYEGAPKLLSRGKNISYSNYILFDNINKIFCKNNMDGYHGLTLIRSIYESLNELLSVDPNYMHQRAKCYIKSAYFEKNKTKKEKFLEKAYREVVSIVFRKIKILPFGSR